MGETISSREADAAAAGGIFCSSGIAADDTIIHRYRQRLVVGLFVIAKDAAPRSGGVTWSEAIGD